tara:strand:- start:98 stop:319 length:222 start_codon:yes stop_codon:yes gene_type:complete
METENKIREFEIINGIHKGIRLDVPKDALPPLHITIYSDDADWELFPHEYCLVAQPIVEGSNEMVYCYEVENQ